MAYITKRGDKWRAQIRRVGHPSISETFTTKARAEAWARKKEADMDEGKKDATIPDDTFAELIDKYVEEIGSVKPIGRTKEDTLRFLRAELGHYTAVELDKNEVLAYVKKRIAGGVSGVTVSIELTYMATVMRAAKLLWGLPYDLDVFETVRANMSMMNISTKSKKRSRRASDAELKKLYAYFAELPRSKIPMADIIAFAVATTMRAGEIIAIRWDDLDEANKTVIIRSRKHPTDKAGNDQLVPLINGAFEIIARQPRTEDRIFPLAFGTITTAFSKATRKAKIDDLRFHDLRHEGISRLFDAGFSIEQVAVFSGHVDWQSLKRYTHLSAKHIHAFAVSRQASAVAGQDNPPHP